MRKLNRAGCVLANGVVAGYIKEYRDGIRDSYVFTYVPDYLVAGSPIGHTFPLTTAEFEFDVLPPFFENLISEGWIRTHQSTRARLDKQDSFGLLLANGEDIIGALSVVPVTEVD
jgi:serine/threonine-protein kinase HipA